MMVRDKLKLNADGTVLIPAQLTKSLNLNGGDQVTVYLDRYQEDLPREYIEAFIHEGIIIDCVS